MLRLALAVSITVVMGAFYLAYLFVDAHIVQRGGALLAAISALLAIIEVSIEGKTSAVARESHLVGGAPRPLTALSRLEARVRGARFRVEAESLSSERIRSVFMISLVAVCGEILHGFGDLIYKAVFAVTTTTH